MDLNKQPETIAEALALASQWNFKHAARIAELETALAEALKDGERLALVQAAADRYFHAYTTAERERVALVKRSHNQRIEIARLQALRGAK